MTEQCMGIIGASLQDRGKGDMIEKAGIKDAPIKLPRRLSGRNICGTGIST